MTPHSPGGGGGGGQGGHGGQSLLTRPLPKTLNQVVFYRITPRVPDPRSLGDGRDSERFGYNDDSPWQPEPSYTRWVQPMESELAKQVEYDMDEVDLEWLNQVNAERRAENLESISFEMFEIVMDKLEKEWFDLQKHIPKPESSLPAEDSKCAICDDGECENSNAIVFCDGCNLAVHQGESLQPDSEVVIQCIRDVITPGSVTICCLLEELVCHFECSTRDACRILILFCGSSMKLYRLLWRPLHSGRTMALSQVHSVSRPTSRESASACRDIFSSLRLQLSRDLSSFVRYTAYSRASSVQPSSELSSRPPMGNGPTSSVRYGSTRPTSVTSSTWNPSTASMQSPGVAGSW